LSEILQRARKNPKMLLPPPETARQLADALSAQQSFRWRRRVMIGTTLILHIRSSELYAIMSEITPTGFRMLPRALVSALASSRVCMSSTEVIRSRAQSNRGGSAEQGTLTYRK
jgi:hypothetical protein